MNGLWLSIIGIGEDGLGGLNADARELVDGAEVFFGGTRHLAMLGDDPRPREGWDNPLSQTIARIGKLKGKAVCVLATGDPMSYGIGVTLAREFGMEQCRVIPHQSAFSLACARLGWPLAEIDCLTLHGRPLGLLNLHLRPNARLLILSENGGTAREVAAMLRQSGYGDSEMSVFQNMGGVKERRFDGLARRWRRRTGDLNTIAVLCRAKAAAAPLMRPAGLPDEMFQHDGQLTKSDVRAVTLAALAPAPDDVLWDVGAGAGSIAIEFLRAEPTARAIAVEQNASRITNIRTNGERLGARNLQIVEGAAPDALKGLARPHVIFIGGGVGDGKVLWACWRALRPGGRLVANAVSLEGEAALLQFMAGKGGAMTRIAISHLDAMGSLHAWRAMHPVTQYRGRKP